MKLPTTQRESRQTTPPAAPGELVLKIHGGTWHGRIVRLAALRCTLGSGPQCSLRMRLPGLAPLVCELDRTAEPALIRCWAAGVLLNGQPCQQAILNIGDRLSLGGMDFEILDGIAAALPWASGFPDQPTKAKKTPPQPEIKKPVAPPASLELPTARPRKFKNRTEKRRRRERDQGIALAPSAPEQKSRLTSKLPRRVEFSLNEQFTPSPLRKVSSKKKSKTPAALREKYMRLREKLRTQQTELELQTTELTAAQAKLAARHEKLLARRAQLETRKTELKSTADQLAGDTKTLQTQQAQLRTQLDELRSHEAALHAEQELLAQQREDIRHQAATLQTQQASQDARAEALQTQAAQMCEQQETLDLLQENLSAELAQFQSQQTQLVQVRGELDRHDEQLRQREERLAQEHERLQSELAEHRLEQHELATDRQQLLCGQEKFREAQTEHEAASKALLVERQSLDTARTELAGVRAELALEQQRLHSASQQQETELLRAKQELALRANEQNSAWEDFAQDQAEHAAAKQELTALDAAWQLDRAAWVDECAVIQAEQQRISLQLSAAETELAEREAELGTCEIDVLARQEQLTQELAAVEAERQILEAATARLACEQMDLEEARGEVRLQAEQLETKLAELLAERAQFDAQRVVLERLLLDQRDSLATDRADFARIRDSYLEERSRWQQTKSRTEHVWSQKFTSLEQREAQSRSEDERLRILLATITQQEQQLAASQEDLQQRRHEASLAVQNLEEQQSAWTQQQQDRERREAEFSAEQTRLEGCRAAFQTEREQWELQQAAWQDERQKLAREQADIDRERKSVHQERSEWDRIRASQLAQASLMAELPSPEEIQQRETSLNQQAEELSAGRDQLRAQQQEHDTQRDEWQTQFREAQAELDRINHERAEFDHQTSKLQSELEGLEGLQGELNELRQQLHSQRQDLESQAADLVARESKLLPREQEICQAGEQLAEREAQLAMERAGYEIQRVKQQELSQNLATQQADTERRLLPHGEQLEAVGRLQQELEQERHTASQLRGELQTLRQVAALPAHTDRGNQGNDQQLAELTAELSQVREELLVQRAANEQEREALAQERVQLEQEHADLLAWYAVQPTDDTESCPTNLEYLTAELAEEATSEVEPVTAEAGETEPGDSEPVASVQANEAEQDNEPDASAETAATSETEALDGNHEDQIFSRLMELTGGKAAAEEKPVREQHTSLRASFFKDDEPAEELEAVADPEQKLAPVQSYLPTNNDEQDEQAEVLATPLAEHSEPAPNAGEGEDESIDDYMQRLLDRMRGSSAGEGKISNQNLSGKDQKAKDVQKRTEQVLREAAEETAKPKREYVRTEAPEKKADLAAMRDLANSTARTAVQTSRNKIAAGQALNKIVVGGGGMAACAGVLMFQGEDETLLQMLVGTSMILSLLWLAYGMYLSRGMLFAKPIRELVLTPPNIADTTDVESEMNASEVPAPSENTTQTEAN